MLTVDQHLALVDLVLDLRAGWLRRQLLGLALTSEDVAERENLLGGRIKLSRPRWASQSLPPPSSATACIPRA
jgi:hypothetical protein